MSNYVPIFDYTGATPQGTQISVSSIPQDADYIWAATVGGGPTNGPVQWGDTCPNGTRAHGGMMVTVDGETKVVFHRS